MQKIIRKMIFKNHRLSDMVAAVCLPMTLILYVHINTISRDLPRDVIITSSGVTYDQSSQYRSNEVSLEEHPAVPDLGPFLNIQVPPPLNNTGNGRQDLVLMTPIVRCGSSAMRNLVKILRKQNSYIFIDEPPKKKSVVHVSKVEIQKNIAGNISGIPDTAVMFQSFAHIDFAKHGYPPPVYISVVREPVARAVSWYYSVRAPFQVVERQFKFPDAKLPSRAFLKKDLESCLRDKNDLECRYVLGREKLGHTIEFFCGHHPNCLLFGDAWSLERAKEAVEHNFAVVGVLEDWDKTLAVLEHYVPRFFTGATKIYYEQLAGQKNKLNQNFYKPRVDPNALEALKSNFTLELEFYNFLRQRLHRQYLAITEGKEKIN